MPFISDKIYSFTFFQNESSIHFSNSANMLSNGVNASSEAAIYAANSIYNVAQIGVQVGIGAICALELAKNGVYVNSAISSDSTFKPFVRNFLVFTADYPLATMGIGAAAMILLNPDPTLNACKNLANTAYKIGEMTVDFTFATKEGLIGVILLTKEKVSTLNEYLSYEKTQENPSEMWHILEKIFVDHPDSSENTCEEWTVIEDIDSLTKETMQVLNTFCSQNHDMFASYTQHHFINPSTDISKVLGDDDEEWTMIPF